MEFVIEPLVLGSVEVSSSTLELLAIAPIRLYVLNIPVGFFLLRNGYEGASYINFLA